MTPQEEIDIAVADLQRKLGADAIALWNRSYPLFKIAGLEKGAATLAALTIFDAAAQVAQHTVMNAPPQEQGAFRGFLHTRLDLVLNGQNAEMSMGPRLIVDNEK